MRTPIILTHASNETQGLWEAGQAALGIMWGSRGATILDDEAADRAGHFKHGIVSCTIGQTRWDPRCYSLVGWLHHFGEYFR